MEKTIKIGEKEYRLHSSVYAIIEYRNVFGTELLKDTQKLASNKIKKDEDLSIVIDTLFKIFYIFHRPFCNISYKEFMMTHDLSLLGDTDTLQVIFSTIVEMLATLQQGAKPSPQFKG